MAKCETPKCTFTKIKSNSSIIPSEARAERKVDQDAFDSVKAAESSMENPFGSLSSVPITLKLFNNFPDHQKVVNFHK